MLPLRVIARSLSSFAMVLMPLHAAAQENGRCFDFATPGVVEAFASRQGQLLVVQVRNPGPGADFAAATLAKEAEQRGLRTVSLAEPWPTNGSDEQDQAHAVRLSSERNAQLSASVQLLTGRDPVAARVEIRDHDGRKLASIVAWSAEASSCSSQLPRMTKAAITESAQAQYSTWYGYQLMLSDLGALGLLVLFPPAGALVFAFVPPAIHFQNQQESRMWTSLALRVGLTAAVTTLFVAGTHRTGREDIDPRLIAGVEGFLLGGLLAVIVDDFVLAWRRTPVPNPAASPPHDTAQVQARVAMMPYHQGAGLGLVGRF